MTDVLLCIIIFCYIIHYLMQPIVDTIETTENIDGECNTKYVTTE